MVELIARGLRHSVTAAPCCMSDASLSHTWTDHERTGLIYSFAHPQAAYRRMEGAGKCTMSSQCGAAAQRNGSRWGWRWHLREAAAAAAAASTAGERQGSTAFLQVENSGACSVMQIMKSQYNCPFFCRKMSKSIVCMELTVTGMQLNSQKPALTHGLLGPSKVVEKRLKITDCN